MSDLTAAPTAPIVPAIPASPPAPATVAVASTGDAALDIAMGYFASKGIDSAGLAMNQAKAGDFSVLRAALQEKGAAGADAYIAIAEQAHQRTAAAAKAAEDALLGTVHKAMGGPDAWAAVKTFIAEKADPAEWDGLVAGLKQGGIVAKATADYMKRVYEAGTGIALGQPSAPPAPAVNPLDMTRGTGSAPQAEPPLSPVQYKEAIAALIKTYGPNAFTKPEYGTAQRRRMQYRG